MILKAEEIRDLAIYAGYTVTDEYETCDLETEFNIQEGPCVVIDSDSGESKCYQHVATCDGCSGNEIHPLGRPI